MDYQPSSRTCFLCGRENPLSLKLRWVNDHKANRVVAHVTVPDDYNSYPGIVHGGVVAAMLDETSGRAVLLEDDNRLFVTLKLETTFRKPTPTGVPLTVVGWIVQDRGTRVKAAGEIRLPDGSVSAKCTSLLVLPPDEVAQGFEAEREHWYVDVE